MTDEEKRRLTITNDNFTSLINKNAFEEYDFILADFGFNNFHIKSPRGFSWLNNEELDMRYNDKYETCKSIVKIFQNLRYKEVPYCSCDK